VCHNVILITITPIQTILDPVFNVISTALLAIVQLMIAHHVGKVDFTLTY